MARKIIFSSSLILFSQFLSNWRGSVTWSKPFLRHWRSHIQHPQVITLQTRKWEMPRKNDWHSAIWSCIFAWVEIKYHSDTQSLICHCMICSISLEYIGDIINKKVKWPSLAVWDSKTWQGDLFSICYLKHFSSAVVYFTKPSTSRRWCVTEIFFPSWQIGLFKLKF